MAAPINDNIKQRILDGTEKLLQQRSFSEISVADIAEATHISKGTIYYYYKNKDDLLYDVAESYADKLFEGLVDWVEDKDDAATFGVLVRAVLQNGVFDDSRKLRLYLILEAVSGNEVIRARILGKYAQFRHAIAHQVRERRKGADGDYFAWLLLLVMDGLMVQNQLGNSELDISDFIAKTVQQFSKE